MRALAPLLQQLLSKAGCLQPLIFTGRENQGGNPASFKGQLPSTSFNLTLYIHLWLMSSLVTLQLLEFIHRGLKMETLTDCKLQRNKGCHRSPQAHRHCAHCDKHLTARLLHVSLQERVCARTNAHIHRHAYTHMCTQKRIHMYSHT